MAEQRDSGLVRFVSATGETRPVCHRGENAGAIAFVTSSDQSLPSKRLWAVGAKHWEKLQKPFRSFSQCPTPVNPPGRNGPKPSWPVKAAVTSSDHQSVCGPK